MGNHANTIRNNKPEEYTLVRHTTENDQFYFSKSKILASEKVLRNSQKLDKKK